MERHDIKNALIHNGIEKIIELTPDLASLLKTGVLSPPSKITEVKNTKAFIKSQRSKAATSALYGISSLAMKAFLHYLEDEAQPTAQPVWCVFGKSPLAYHIYIDVSPDQGFLAIECLKAAENGKKVLYSYFVDGRWVPEGENR